MIVNEPNNFCPGLYDVIRKINQVLHNCTASQHIFCSESLGSRVFARSKVSLSPQRMITLHYSCSSNLIRESLSSNEVAQEIWRSKSSTKGCVECHFKMTDLLTLVESCE